MDSVRVRTPSRSGLRSAAHEPQMGSDVPLGPLFSRRASLGPRSRKRRGQGRSAAPQSRPPRATS
jgi:hypothetical protein